jgi:signal transduction histidine kinase
LLLRCAEVGLALALVSIAVSPASRPTWALLLDVAYFVGLEVYAALVFAREARRSTGVTRRRMQAVAAGSIFLGLVILLAGVQIEEPGLAGAVALASSISALCSGVAYFVGFAPPPLLRRAWRAPELDRFLARVTTLTQVADSDAAIRALEDGVAASLGVADAAIGLWDQSARVLRFDRGDVHAAIAPGEWIVGQVFASQQPRFVPDAARADPAHAEVYRARDIRAALAAPIAVGPRPLGVLLVYTHRAPLFGEEDLRLVELLASQAAMVLQNRALIDELARSRARQEATRLRDDFLSAAAHDLKTPLTTVVAQAQLLERRAARDPRAPVDLDGVRRIAREARRLNDLILKLLDVSRMEEGGAWIGPREELDLVSLAREVGHRLETPRHRVIVEDGAPLIGRWDRIRMAQLLDNLIGNAVKFSPAGGEVRVQLRREGRRCHLSVLDRGIGIPPGDLPYVFERFHRGANVDDRRFAGMGLGLYIARQIVEENGGEIWATSAPNQGTAIHVLLPLATPEHPARLPLTDRQQQTMEF